MKQKIKNYFKLLGLEFIRIWRNKPVLILLVLFPIISMSMLIVLQHGNNSLDTSRKNNQFSFPMAIYKVGDVDNSEIFTLIDSKFDTTAFITVETKEEGIDMLNCGDVCFLLMINGTSEPVTATFIYDDANIVSGSIKKSLSNEINKYTVDSVANFLNEYGIVLNEKYFNLVTFDGINTTESTLSRTNFIIQTSCFLAISIMIGLAFSITRDNETNVNKQLSYTPISPIRYLSTKIITYIIIGVFQFCLMMLLCYLFFNIELKTNFFIILLLALLFIISVCSFGTLSCLLKSQIATILVDLLIIMVPMLIYFSFPFNTLILPFKIVLLVFPVTPFMQILSYSCFNGIILWKYVLILFLQILIFLPITILIMRVKRNK